jgi:hypothetical protein
MRNAALAVRSLRGTIMSVGQQRGSWKIFIEVVLSAHGFSKQRRRISVQRLSQHIEVDMRGTKIRSSVGPSLLRTLTIRSQELVPHLLEYYVMNAITLVVEDILISVQLKHS